MPTASLFTILSAAVVVLYAVGVHYLIYAPKERSCGMTYMFEYPQFAKIAMPEDVARVHKRYSLWAYSEGHHIDAMRKMKFSGIPILFLPGSGGSHKQARSLASVCMRKALNSRSPFHMDFFTVDLNEEYSALYGGVLESQTEFVRQSIFRILELYKNNKSYRPTSVVLVGHSMSGLIAKGIFNDPSFDPNLVQVILTFATPHSRPVILFDEYSYNYYQTTSKTWRLGRANRLSHITLTSVGGGHMDYLVQSDSVASWEIDVHTVTTTVPTVWRSVDHLAILWCKELVLVSARMLFDMVDLETKQVTSDRDLRNSIVSYHLLHRNSGKQFRKSVHHQYVAFTEGAEWIEPLPRQRSISGNIDPNGNDQLKKPKNVMIRLVDHPQHAILAVEAINHQDGDWLFVCQANIIEKDYRVCRSGENLSNASMFWPSLRHKRKRAVLDLTTLYQQNFSHVILRMPYNHEPVQFNIDVHANRVLKPPSLGLWMLFDTRPAVLVEETTPKALRYVVDFSEVESLWHVMNLVVKPVNCLNKEHHAVAMMVIPWSNEKVFSFINEVRSDPLLVRLLHVKPRLPRDASKQLESRMGVKAEISLDPSCTYSIRLEAAPGSVFSQFVRSLTPCVFAYMVAILLLTLREQLQSLSRTGQCSLFHLALCRGAKPFYILPLCKILTRILTPSDDFSSRNFLNTFGIPEPGMSMMARTPMENLLYPFLLYLCAFGLVYLSGFLVMLGIVFNAKVISAVALSFVGRFFKRSVMSWISPSSLSDFLVECMLRAPPIVVALLLILAYNSCGALGLIIGGIYFYAILCNMYNDYLEALLKYSMRVVAGKAKISLHRIVNPGNARDSTRQAAPETKEITSETKEAVPETKEEGNEVEIQQEDEKALITPSSSENVDKTDDNNEEDRNTLSDINIYMTVFFIYVAAIVPSIPSLLVWAHNYHFDHSLVPDPTFYPFVVILMTVASTFWIHAYPHPDLPFYRIVADCLFALATFTLLYAPTRISFIPFVVSGVMVLLACHQWLTTLLVFLFPPTYNEQLESENESDADSINDNHGDSSHSVTDDEVADGDDEGGESGSNSDYNEDTNETEKRKAFPIRTVAQPHRTESEDDSSDAEPHPDVDGDMNDLPALTK